MQSRSTHVSNIVHQILLLNTLAVSCECACISSKEQFLVTMTWMQEATDMLLQAGANKTTDV